MLKRFKGVLCLQIADDFPGQESMDKHITLQYYGCHDEDQVVDKKN